MFQEVFSCLLSGDQIIAFQGDISTPSLVYALNDDGAGVWAADATSSNNSALPSGLVNGFSAVALNEVDNAYYSDGPYTDLNILRAAIGDNTLWTGTDTGGYDFTVVFADGNLPVELSSFTAEVNENKVLLNWRTETEVNNYGFEILRQAQDDTWQLLGFVEGNGNSNSPKYYSYTDNSVSSGSYFYRLKQIDNDGRFEYSKVVEITVSDVTTFQLGQNYPNPFNPSTEIRFSIPETGNVNLTVYNIIGEQVAVLLNGVMEAGSHTINFNAENLLSGIYFYTLKTGNIVEMKKMILLK